MDNEIARPFIVELREQCSRLADFPQGGALAKDRILRSFDFRYIVHRDYLMSTKKCTENAGFPPRFSVHLSYLGITSERVRQKLP